MRVLEPALRCLASRPPPAPQRPGEYRPYSIGSYGENDLERRRSKNMEMLEIREFLVEVLNVGEDSFTGEAEKTEEKTATTLRL